MMYNFMKMSEIPAKSIDPEKPLMFFAVPNKKLVLLSLSTFGIYELYWAYKNWKVIEIKEDISPIPRTFFHAIFVFGLFKRIFESGKKQGFSEYTSVDLVATLYFILLISGSISGREWFYTAYPVASSLLFIVSTFTVWALMEIQKIIIFNNKTIDPTYEPVKRFNLFEKALLVVGGLIFLVTLFFEFQTIINSFI
jgi:hypothetical protein